MKRLLIVTAIAISVPSLVSAEYVSGYYRQDGTYVQPHHRSTPDGNYSNNYSSQGNSNPYTGQQGTVTYQQYQTQRQQNNTYNSSGIHCDNYGRCR